jgi:WD40 repeat protein
MEGPSGSIFSCAFARGSRPGEDYLFCAGEDKMVHKFSCADGEWLAVLAGHRRDIYSVCVAPAGESKGAAGVVLSAGRDGLLKLWDVEGGAEEQDAIGQINCGTGIEGLVACGDRCCLTAKRCGVVELWDYQKGLFTPPPRLAAGLHNPVVRRGAKGAAARVVQPEIYSRDTKLSCVDACAGWICTGSVDGSIDVWASC